MVFDIYLLPVPVSVRFHILLLSMNSNSDVGCKKKIHIIVFTLKAQKKWIHELRTKKKRWESLNWDKLPYFDYSKFKILDTEKISLSFIAPCVRYKKMWKVAYVD
jgi:hypothetical protein